MVHSLLDALPHRRPKATGLTNPRLEIGECEPRENSSLSKLIASGICYGNRSLYTVNTRSEEMDRLTTASSYSKQSEQLATTFNESDHNSIDLGL